MKSLYDVVVGLLFYGSSISYDMTDLNVCCIAEDITLELPYFYSYLEKYCFIMKRLEDR